MDPARKRKTRLVVTLGIALLLATALIYTSFGASTVASTPTQLLAASTPGKSYELSGRVVAGSVERKGDSMKFRVMDRSGSDGSRSILVKYTGTVPDPFREGREVIVSGRVVDGVLVARPNSLVTKCPSKYSNSKQGDGSSGTAGPAGSY
jgi:cytochrome c-type biogenesis protein CcmE